jgi:hypothetical protein
LRGIPIRDMPVTAAGGVREASSFLVMALLVKCLGVDWDL